MTAKGTAEEDKAMATAGCGDGTPNPKHKYSQNCKRVVGHKVSTSYFFESNTATRPAWWRKKVKGIP